MSLTRNELRISASAPRRNLMGAAAFAAGLQLGKRPIMLTRGDSTISASRGTLAGDILWVATIAFVFAIITGIVR